MYEQEINQDRSKPELSEVDDHGEETRRTNDHNMKVSKSQK